MAKRTVENAGGTITVQSQPDVGTTFTVFPLPKLSAPLYAALSPLRRPMHGPRGWSVLKAEWLDRGGEFATLPEARPEAACYPLLISASPVATPRWAVVSRTNLSATV